MNVTPAGILAVPLSTLRTMLSACPSFQGLVRAASANAALASIVYSGQAGETTRPFASVGFTSHDPRPMSGGSQTYWSPAGRLEVLLEVPASWAAAVTAESAADSFTCAALANWTADFAKGLVLQVTTGPRASESKVIAAQTALGVITLASALTGLPGVGAAVDLRAADEQDAAAHFLNVAGAIFSELQNLSGRSGYLAFHSARLADWGRNKEDNGVAQDYWGARFELEYGP